MLRITIKPEEHYDEIENRFFMYPEKPVELVLEHSLLSISKWEEKWHKPFLTKEQLSNEETLDYVRCMLIRPSPDNIDLKLLLNLSPENAREINAYISNTMTATFFSDKEKKRNPRNEKIITNELIYFWMVSYQIPFDPCEKWHINKLLTLIRVCNAENEAANKKAEKNKSGRPSASDISARKALNAQRRAKLHSRG